MVFSSLLFLFFFLPACLACYYAFPGLRVRNLILTGFSLLFYAWGEPIWVGLLILTAAVDWLNGLWIERYRGSSRAIYGLWCSLAFNLGLLGTFKYSDFIVSNVNHLTGLQFPLPGFLLPIGISFYTFQSLSYIFDVYRGEVGAQRRFSNYLLFVSSFHQLVAGPIVRYVHVAREIEQRAFDPQVFSSGVARFCKGLFKKVFFANIAGELAGSFLDKPAAESSVAGAWFGLLMFSLQIYFDFSGYSDMAIGLGRMFGFHYQENFRHPYIATSVTDFWRRWHISMGQFFRDYVYIPLGGNRRHANRNLFTVWALTGLWHGASWNFVLWGLYFGVLLYLERAVGVERLQRWPRSLVRAYALLAIMMGWSLFYFTDLSKWREFVNVLSGLGGQPWSDFYVHSSVASHAVWLVAALALCAPLSQAVHRALSQVLGSSRHELVIGILSVIFLFTSVAFLVGQSYNPFIYFRF